MIYRVLFFLLLVVIAEPGISRAQELSSEQAQKAARAGLSEGARFPWYDAEHDTLRDVRANQRNTDDSRTRLEGWQKTAKPTTTPAAPNAPLPWTWSGWFGNGLQYVALFALVALLALLIYLLVRYFLLDEELASSRGELRVEEDDRRGDADRVENLPFQVRTTVEDPLQTARRLYEASRYEEAIVYLYAYELMQLDRHQWIHLAKGKTNRQYLREVRSSRELRDLMELTVIAFEDAFFGKHTLPRKRFEDCWHRLEEFHRLVDALPADTGAAA